MAKILKQWNYSCMKLLFIRGYIQFGRGYFLFGCGYFLSIRGYILFGRGYFLISRGYFPQVYYILFVAGECALMQDQHQH